MSGLFSENRQAVDSRDTCEADDKGLNRLSVDGKPEEIFTNPSEWGK